MAMSECIKYNKVIKTIDLTNNRLNFDAAKSIAESLKLNTTLESLNVKIKLLILNKRMVKFKKLFKNFYFTIS